MTLKQEKLAALFRSARVIPVIAIERLADAVPLATYLDDAPGLLPAWYMPTPMTRIRPRWRTPVVVAIVAAFVAIEAFGLCSTFGQIVPA